MNSRVIYDEQQIIPARRARSGHCMIGSHVARRTLTAYSADYYGKGAQIYIRDRQYIGDRLQPTSSDYPLDSAPQWIQSLA